MGVDIRTATAADDTALGAIDEVTWSPLVTPSAAPEPGEAMMGPGREPEDYLVAEVDGIIAGYVMIGREIPIEANAHVHKIRGLAVAPEFQRRGIARQLMGAAITELTSRGASRIRSRVLGTNPASIALHHALGFEVVGVLRGEFVIGGTPVDDILWTLDVTAAERVERPAMGLTFVEVTEDRLEDLIEVMLSSRWEHFVRPEHTDESVRALWNEGAFGEPDNATFLVVDSSGGNVGMIRLTDLQDPIPLFDIRIRDDARGQGIGTTTLTWLTEHLFERGFASVQGYTRAVNTAMRATFERCGYAKEGHMRADEVGGHDHIAYRILRRDVESGSRTPVRWFDV